MTDNGKIRKTQMSERFILNAILALSGGFQDAYTYMVRGEVFANAQTGNLVLMSTHFMSGNLESGVQYLLPLVAFSAGVFVAEWVQIHFKAAKKLHWRQGILFVEIAMLCLAGFLPHRFDLYANMLVSLSCAMQVQAFRKVSGNAYSSTMCIGNIRSGVTALYAWVRTKEQKDAKRALYYFGIIVIFAIGAGLGGNISKMIGIHAIFISCGILLVAALLMMNFPLKTANNERKER